MRGLLEGIRVIDFTQAIAGPFGSVVLADMGAEIIKVENVPRTDPPATTNPEEIEVTMDIAHFWALNRGKKGICLDMRKESAREVFYDLVKVSDIVFDNFRPDVPKKLAIDYEAIEQYNPRIISCSISGYGEGGPWKDQPSFDVIGQAMSGLMSITGEAPGRMPVRTGVAFGDVGAGIFAAFGIVCALLAREQTGKGQRVETSILDCLLAYLAYRVPQTFGAGKKIGPEPRRSGAGQVPYGAFKAKEGWIVIAAGMEHHWKGFCKVVGREDLITDPHFDTVLKRREHEDGLNQILEEVFRAKTAEEWEQLFFEAKVPASKVNTVEEAFLHPQAQVRKMLISFDHRLGKKMNCAGNPLKISDFKDQQYEPAPGIGEHTREVLSKILLYPDGKIEKLREERAIWYPDKGVTYGAGWALARGG